MTYFDPIPDLNPGDDGDISLIFLRNGVTYIQPVADPWFHADTAVSTDFGFNLSASAMAYSVLGCVERYQVCIDKSCSGFTGYYNMMQSNLTIPLSTQNLAQNAIFQLMWKAIWVSQTKYLVTLLNQNILLANDYLCKLNKNSHSRLSIPSTLRTSLFLSGATS